MIPPAHASDSERCQKNWPHNQSILDLTNLGKPRRLFIPNQIHHIAILHVIHASLQNWKILLSPFAIRDQKRGDAFPDLTFIFKKQNPQQLSRATVGKQFGKPSSVTSDLEMKKSLRKPPQILHVPDASSFTPLWIAPPTSCLSQH